MSWAAISAAEAMAFTLTVGIEWPLLAWFSKLGFRATGPLCLCMNGFTWFAAAGVLRQWTVPIPLLEAGIIVVEAVIMGVFWQWNVRKAAAASLLLNLSSWLLGEQLLKMILRIV